MKEHRFHLKKYDTSRRDNKLTCPQCGKRKRFVKYVDEEGKIVFPDYVGKCDREVKCGYHYTPKDYFRDNPDAKAELQDESYSYDKPYFPNAPHVRVMEKTEPAVPSYFPS